MQYHHFARRQREELAAGGQQRAQEYWQKQLTGFSSLPLLPPDLPRLTGEERHRAQLFHAALDPELSAALLRVSRERQASPYMTLLAAWALVFSRYAQREDILLGSLIANRDREELESLVGFFVNTLPLRFALDGSPTGAELLARVREVTLDAYAHQELPFDKIVELAQPERDQGEIPLIQVMVIMQNAPMGELKLPGLTAQIYPVATKSVRFDLEIYFWEAQGCLQCDLVYKEKLFRPATIQRLWSCLRAALAGMIGDIRRPVDKISLISGEEQSRLANLGQGARRRWLSDSLPQLVAAQARITPSAPAVTGAEGTISYRS